MSQLRSRRRPVAATGLAALAVCCAGACSGSGDAAAPAATVTVTATVTDTVTSTVTAAAAPTSGSSSPSATPTGSSIPGTYTPEDAKLRLGQMATVPYTASKVTGPLGVTVTAIEKGTAADLASLRLGDRAKGLIPYYIRITVTNVAGGPFTYSSLSSVSGVLGDGSQAQDVFTIGDFQKCDSSSAGRDFGTKGATYTTCKTALAAPGAAVVGAQYDSSYSGGDNPPPNTEYSRHPVVWKQ